MTRWFMVLGIGTVLIVSAACSPQASSVGRPDQAGTAEIVSTTAVAESRAVTSTTTPMTTTSTPAPAAAVREFDDASLIENIRRFQDEMANADGDMSLSGWRDMADEYRRVTGEIDASLPFVEDQAVAEALTEFGLAFEAMAEAVDVAIELIDGGRVPEGGTIEHLDASTKERAYEPTRRAMYHLMDAEDLLTAAGY